MSANLTYVTERRRPAECIAEAIASHSTTVEHTEKAAGLPSGELKTYLDGGDIPVRSLVAAGGLLGVPIQDLFREDN